MRMLVEGDRIVIIWFLLKDTKPEGAATRWNTGESVLWVMYWAKKGKVVQMLLIGGSCLGEQYFLR